MRFYRKGTMKIFFVPTIAAASLIPTRAEITAGTDYTKATAALDGWSIENSPIDTPDMASTFTSKIPGDDAAPDSSLTFYEDDLVDDVETDLAKGTTGFVVMMSKGDIPSGKGMDVFPVMVSSNSKPYTADNEPAKIQVQFVITDRPLQNGTVPAAT